MTKYEIIKNKLDNPSDKNIHVWMNFTAVSDDDETTIFTDSIATCIGLGIVAKGENNTIHRIVSHNYAYSEGFQLRQLDSIVEYLKSIPSLKELKVIFCSMKSFSDFDNLTEHEQEILLRLNNAFSFYKKDNPDFNIEFHKSWYLIIDPKGNFDYADEELLVDYIKEEEILKRNIRI